MSKLPTMIEHCLKKGNTLGRLQIALKIKNLFLGEPVVHAEKVTGSP